MPEPFTMAVLYRYGAPVEVRYDDPVWAGGAIVDAVCEDRANPDAYRMVFTHVGGGEAVTTTGADVVAKDRALAEDLGLQPIWPADATALERAELWGWVAPDVRFERVTYFGRSSYPMLDRPASSPRGEER